MVKLRLKSKWWIFWYLVALALVCLYALAQDQEQTLPNPISPIQLPPLGVVTRVDRDTNPVPMSVGLTTYEPRGVVTRPVPLDPMTPIFVANVRVIGTNPPAGITNHLEFFYPVSVGKLPLFDVWGTTNTWKGHFVVFSNLLYGSESPLYPTTNADAMKFRGVRHQ